MTLKHHIFCLFFPLLCSVQMEGQNKQIDVQRIEMMPNEPAPYNLRDWRNITIGYDSIVYDLDKAGLYLPMIFVEDQGLNYPENQSFGLDSYVGTISNNAGEAINVLPSLVGATLVGIDKSNQYGLNWILMSQDYFNKENGELIYLNNIGGHSGSDWWYDMMPNIYFYQLYDLYGDLGDAAFQFESIADRFAGAVRSMGGSDTPWSPAYMDYRAWNFIEGKPNESGVREPEAAGAFAWILYHAYNQLGNPEYLKGAEWSMEFLNGLGSNPSYELQLPYGTFIAAKMNAELGTGYDIEKMVNWIFNRGPIRGWGTIVGNWGGVDVSGLVGEANDNGNDYAFLMNGLHQAAALVPMTRYDKRFSRAIGKWVLNLANATRLMYPGFLPTRQQDASDWSEAYDPKGYIGYEALREQLAGFRPFSTGDALKSGWAATNLALYGSSSVGYLGSLIELTDVEKILLIDLLKTDFFHDEVYPSYLLFNPYNSVKDVALNVGDSRVDIYDAISETFLLSGVSGDVTLSIPPGKVVSLVYTPEGGNITFQCKKMLINNVIVDYMQSAADCNTPPRIQSLAPKPATLEFGDTAVVYAKAYDPDTQDLSYQWYSESGVITGEGMMIKWIAPESGGEYDITLVVSDNENSSDTANVTILVVAEINVAPQIIELSGEKRFVMPGNSVLLTCLATDPNGDPLSYTWTTNGGMIDGVGNQISWISPSIEGIYSINVKVEDDHGAFVTAEIRILVRDFSNIEPGNLIAYYPFSGNAQDESGNGLHGMVVGAKLTSDLTGEPFSAYFFDGINDHIRVPNEELLNFSRGITVSCWMLAEALPDKETFIISHGSWHNRWKISITPDRKVRWTLKNSVGQIRDLDSESTLEEDIFYHVTVTYDGEFFLLFLDGVLESATTMTGEINPSPVDLEIAQMLPDNQAYNFRGIIDEVMLYDFALHPDTIFSLSGNMTTGTGNLAFPGRGLKVNLFPNPLSQHLTFEIETLNHNSKTGRLDISLIDQRGAELMRWKFELTNRKQLDLSVLDPGIYFIRVIGETWAQIHKLIKI